MKAIGICISGLEDIAIDEIKELINTKATKIEEGRISFNFKNKKDLAKLVCYTRCLTKVYELLVLVEDYEKDLTKIKLNHLIKNGTFAVRTEKINKDLDSREIEREFGNLINKDNKLKVNLEDPKTTIIVEIINNKCYIGIDYCGIRLNKRSYRIKTIASSLNGSIAYSLLKISKWKEKEVLLDPFCRDGIIIIEAALSALKMPNQTNDKLLFNKFLKYNCKKPNKKLKLKIFASDSQMFNVRASEINSKIAGINKSLKFSRTPPDDLELKFKENSIDKIVTFIPHETKSTLRDVKQELIDFFYQSEYILKNKGTITLITLKPEETKDITKRYKLKLKMERKITHGDLNYSILIFEKGF